MLPRSAGEERSGAPLRCCVVDASASAHRTRNQWLRWVRGELRTEARAAQAAGESFAVVVFAEEVTRAFSPGAPATFLDRLDGRGGALFEPRVTRDGASRLAAALQVAGAVCSAPGRKPGRVVLLGTGSYTGPDPAGVLLRLARAGCRFERRPPPPRDLGDLALLDLFVPPFIEADAPLGGRALLSYRPGRSVVVSAELKIVLDGATGKRSFSIPLSPPARGGRFEVPLRLGPAAFGRTVVAVQARLQLRGADGAVYEDPLSENDRLQASTKAFGELVIGVVSRADQESAARRWLAPSGTSSLQGIQWVFTQPDELPLLLEQLDAVVAFDLTPRELPEAVLVDFLKRGGGYLATSGWGLLKDWFPGRTASGLAGLLPLEPAPHESPPREVVLLVDGSGSMAGEPFELVRRATLDLVAAALPSDRVSLRFFRTHLEPPRLIKLRTTTEAGEASSAERIEHEAERAAERLIDLEVPEGSTFLLSSLEHFAAAEYEGEVLALLLTDGEEQDGIANLTARADALHAKLRADKKRLVAIAIRSKPRALGFLREVVPVGEEVLQVDELADLQAIFRQEVSRAQVRRGEIPVLGAARRPGSLVAEIEAAGGQLPALEQLVRNRLRPGAEVLWESERGEPVLAAMRVGAGRSACLSSLPHPGWASNYTDRVGLGEPRLFGALLRWLARRSEFDEHVLELRVDGDELWLAGFDERWPLHVDAALVAAVRDAELGDIVLRPPAPPLAEGFVGSDTRRVRHAVLSPELRARLRGVQALLRIEAPAGGDPVLLPMLTPRAPEFAHEEKELILPVAEIQEARPEGLRSRAQHPLGPLVLAAGLGLLLAAALLRSR